MAGVRVVGLPAATPRRRRDEDSSPRRHLRLVLPARRSLRLSPRLGVLLTVVGFVALFGVAVCHALLIQNQASVDELDRRVAAEQARYEQLRLEVAELESPQRITTEAQNDLGMVPAGETMWLTPDQPAPTSTTAPDAVESTDTSAAEVKPYLEAAP
jgi:cell division protein FtsL